MFSGIIEEIGQVSGIKQSSGRTFAVEASFARQCSVGDSVAINGACLTVNAVENNRFFVFASAETLQCTNLKNLKTGSYVNMERAVPVNGRLDGHLVYGHIDAVGRIIEIQPGRESRLIKISNASEYAGYIIKKGSAAVNGVSLTVYEKDLSSFTVMIIPHTFEHTVFKYLKSGEQVNIEFDVIAKYTENFINSRK
ncbi:MAG: riboflavin synthase subunit alpha [Spirochaetes bacterium GWF1_41_5]|nr:MAG: riboflavin synthase subunit alpha [Spirochaetes bacterium GWF1_41_5]HBE03724.1 riboflavin synthase [Spirochaetia bacterium]